ncbi:hypothetical protein [Occultella gossypii]|uniref:Uncharacterized protein n=1 Tax=Occultella gossypii TaxID=2800820 RepID=A0ABS7SBR0_9MICO|nr:hypothetical protein [Occultella gossypii]MBZ2197124.1 hypothetical protein [Occultella gossypii]
MLRRSKKLTPTAFWYFLAAAAVPSVLGLLSALAIRIAVGSGSVWTYTFELSRRGRPVGNAPAQASEFSAEQILYFVPWTAIIGAVCLALAVLFCIRWPTSLLGTLAILLISLSGVNAGMSALTSRASWGGFGVIMIGLAAVVGQRMLLGLAQSKLRVVVPEGAAGVQGRAPSQGRPAPSVRPAPLGQAADLPPDTRPGR